MDESQIQTGLFENHSQEPEHWNRVQHVEERSKHTGSTMLIIVGLASLLLLEQTHWSLMTAGWKSHFSWRLSVPVKLSPNQSWKVLLKDTLFKPAGSYIRWAMCQCKATVSPGSKIATPSFSCGWHAFAWCQKKTGSSPTQNKLLTLPHSLLSHTHPTTCHTRFCTRCFLQRDAVSQRTRQMSCFSPFF